MLIGNFFQEFDFRFNETWIGQHVKPVPVGPFTRVRSVAQLPQEHEVIRMKDAGSDIDANAVPMEAKVS